MKIYNFRKEKFSLTIATLVIIAVASFLNFGSNSFGGVHIATASCDPTNPNTTPPHIASINPPEGDYHNPGSVPIVITGEGGYECFGDPNGGTGNDMVNVAVSYTISNQNGNQVYSGTWSAPHCTVVICAQRPILVSTSADASSWPAGTYTLNAEANGAGGSDQASKTFTISRDGGCTNNCGGDPNYKTVTASVNVDVGIVNGGRASVDLKCTGKNNLNPIDGPCYIDPGSYAMLSWSTVNVTACSIDQGFGSVALNNPAPGSSTGNLSAPVTRFTLSCTGPSNPPSSPKTDYVDIHTDVAPSAPQIKSTDNSICGTVKLSWQVVSGNDPVSFNIYRSTDSSNLPGNKLGSVDFTSRSAIYTYPDSPNPLDIPYYYSVSAVSAGGSESAYAQSQVVPTSCKPSFGGSDKDIKSVVGRVSKDWTADLKPCSNESEVVSLPNNALFGVNDKVTFQLNICNTGTEDLNNIIVNDTPINLSNLMYVSSWDGNSACTDPNRFSYNSQTNSLTIHTDSVPKTDNSSNPKYCRVVYRGTVTAPANPTTDIYRFQNKAVIHADNVEPKTVTTPPYLFSLSGGVPNRNETAPSH